MKGNHFFHKEELIHILDNIVGKTFGEVDKNNIFDRTIDKPKITGIAGDVIEQSVLCYPADQSQRPDLDVDGILTELKTTGMRLKKDGNRKIYEAKEPVSITAVSIATIASEDIFNSNFWHKVSNILFVFYHYESPKAVPAAAYADFHIRRYCFYQFSPDDVTILKKDWQIIHDFIADLQSKYTEEHVKQYYPSLSTIINKKLTYLDTAPKYPHAPRFRIRKRVITVIIQQTFDRNMFEKLPDKYLNQSDVREKCVYITELFLGWSMADILEHCDVQIDRARKIQLKQYAEQVIVRMFGGTAKKISKIEMFRKFGYVGKSITIRPNGMRTEDTKLISVNFEELTELMILDEGGKLRKKTFEDSDLYNYFYDNKFLCVIFQESHPDKDGKVRLDDNKFLGFKILDLSDDELISAAKQTWNDAREIINNGKLEFVPTLDKEGYQRYSPKTQIPMGAPNLPKSENSTVFFRGTGRDATDKIQINGIEILRQSYWIKGTYIVERLKNIPFIGYEQFTNTRKPKGEYDQYDLRAGEKANPYNIN